MKKFIATMFIGVMILSGCSSSDYSKSISEVSPQDGISLDSSSGLLRESEIKMEDSESQMKKDDYLTDKDGGIKEDENVKKQADDKKIIKRAYIDMDVTNVQDVVKNIKDYVTKKQGYLETSKVGSVLGNGNKEYNTGYIVIRIPSNEYDGMLNEVGNMGKITNLEDSVENVTLSYIDFESQLKVKRIEEDRLLELISKASSLESIISLEARLSEVRGVIEHLTSTLRQWDNLVKMSTITINLNEKSIETISTTEDYDFFRELGNAFVLSINNTTQFVSSLIIFIALNWIKILVFIGIIKFAMMRLKKDKNIDMKERIKSVLEKDKRSDNK